MDKQVQLAMAKWPNVPDCYGWLALDARGNWRMRDQRCQDLGQPGSKIGNMALREFIARNYLVDAKGRFFFQNGPQRVFVELEATPYIAHSDPKSGWVLHTGVMLEKCDEVWMTHAGMLVLASDDYLAQIDDRDMAQALAALYLDGQRASDDEIIDWLEQPTQLLTWRFAGKDLPVVSGTIGRLMADRHFVSSPQSYTE